MHKLYLNFLATAMMVTLSFNFQVFADDEPQPEPTKKTEEAVAENKQDDDPYKAALEFVRAMTIIRNTYVDKDKATYKKLFDAALQGMLQELDPFSSYEQAERFKSLTDESAGHFAGIGATLSMRNHFLEVISIIPNSPSSKAKLKPGDIITEIDGKPITGLDMDATLKMIRGEAGTKLELTVYRSSDDKTHNITLERAIINISTITGTQMLDGKIGYFHITQFSMTTATDMDKAIQSLKEKDMKALIVDVRNNPGGLLDSGVQVCSRFIKTGELVVSIEGRDTEKFRHYSVNSTKTQDIPLVILINGNSASAAEIFAACMQDYKRAVLVGEKSFGKGSVQSIVPFGQDAALRITTAKYYTPSRRVIHDNGVKPDITVPLSRAHSAALANQLSNHPGKVIPLIPNPARDIQLERAIEMLKSLMIFQESKQ